MSQIPVSARKPASSVPFAIVALVLLVAVTAAAIAIVHPSFGSPSVATSTGVTSSVVEPVKNRLDSEYLRTLAASGWTSPVAPVAQDLRGSLQSEYLLSISAGWGRASQPALIDQLDSEYLRSIAATWGHETHGSGSVLDRLDSLYLREIAAGW
jgi:hypothetical protein